MNMEADPYDFLALDTLAGTGFRSTSDTDDLAQRVKDSLGFGAFNIPARLAIARSLAIPHAPAKPDGDLGRTIKGETLFGTGPDLAAWISLIIEHAGRRPKNLKEVQALVAAHWSRGMISLASTLDREGDSGEFWKSLAETALPATSSATNPDSSPSKSSEETPHAIEVRVGEIGKDLATGEEVVWRLNAPGGSPHSAFMGGVGSGKTRTATFVLRSLSKMTSAPLIAIDFKGDMSDSRNALDTAFGATIVRPPHQPIPLDVFALADNNPHTIISTAQRLRDSLGNLKQTKFGDQQRRRLNDALEDALRSHYPCTLQNIRDSLQNIYASQNIKEDGAISTLVDLCRLPLFEPTYSPEEFFSRSWIITLPADVPDLVRVSVVSLLTDSLERYINSLPDAATDSEGNRAMRSICVIDEAHRILGTRLPGLANLIRLSRSKGGSVMLISQRPDDFEGEDDDFLAEMGLITCFGTNARETSVRKILGANASLVTLKTGEAYVKLRGDARAKKVAAWK